MRIIDSIIKFTTNNYEWLFSGIGITFLVWLENYAKKAARKIKDAGIIEQLLRKNRDQPPKYFTIVDEKGVEEQAEIVLAFEFSDTQQEFIVYTKRETDKYGNVTAYVSEIDRSSGKPRFLGISSNRKWKHVREVLKELANSRETQPIYDEQGIEII